MSDRAILHIDMNNFYASVECMMNPDLKPHPIAVCGSQEDRHGIVLAKNYKAKAFGVSTGEAIWQAKQKCPNLVSLLSSAPSESCRLVYVHLYAQR